jgi:hypothetical protein
MHNALQDAGLAKVGKICMEVEFLVISTCQVQCDLTGWFKGINLPVRLWRTPLRLPTHASAGREEGMVDVLELAL